MKNLFIAVTMLVGTIASADLGSRTYQSNLKSFNLDQHLSYEYGNIDVDGGTITLDYARKEANLTLYRKMDCPPGRICAMVMPPPIVIKLKIKSQKTNDCGSKVVTAHDIRTDVASRFPPNSHVLTITDNRGNHCPHFVALPDTQVELATVFAVTEPMFFRLRTHSFMTGDALVRTDDQL